MSKTSILLDNKIVFADDSFIDSMSPGSIMHAGVFETVRVYGLKILGFKEHVMRMNRGLRLLKMKYLANQKELYAGICKILLLNKMEDARVRISVWRGLEREHILIICYPLDPSLETKYKKGYRAVLSGIEKSRTAFSNIKSLDYFGLREEYLKAQKAGYDEVLFLNNRKSIVEGSRTNIFYFMDNTLCSPPVSSGCLNGITRQIVIKLTKRAGIPFQTREINVEGLQEAQEVFLTNSILEIMPLTSIQGNFISQGKVGDVTVRLFYEYRSLCEKLLG